MDARYEIVQAMPGEFYGHRGGNWDSIRNDDAPDGYGSIEEAEAAIDDLVAQGDGWEDGTYAVREVGERWPDAGAYYGEIE